MKVDKKDLAKLAHLARLSFDEQKDSHLLNDLVKIIDWMGELDQLNTDGVEPLTHMSFEENVYRPDVAAPSLDRSLGLSNAPRKDSEYIRVPKVIE